MIGLGRGVSRGSLIRCLFAHRFFYLVRSLLFTSELVQAWVGQNVSLFNVCETTFFAPPCVADEYIAAAPVGHGRPSAAQ